MICLDNTDVIEGGASVDAVIDYQIHGLVGTTFTQLAAGVMNITLTAVLYTAGAAISVVSIILVNKHTSAVDITLCLDPANGGVPRYLIPKTISLGAGYSLHTDGARLTIIDASGGLVTGVNVSDIAYAAGWNGETKVAPSKNAVYDKIQTILGDVTAAANIDANAPVVGDDGAKGVKKYVTNILNLVQMSRSQFTYHDADQITCAAAQYMCKDKYCHWISTLTTVATGAAGGSDWWYLYLDYSAITSGTVLTASELIWSTTEPTWNTTYRQWMNGDDRCIFAVRTTGANAIIEFFHSGSTVWFADKLEFLATVDIDTTWTDATLIMPNFAREAITSWAKAVADQTWYWRTNGQTGTVGHVITVFSNPVNWEADIRVITSSAQIIEVKASASNTAQISGYIDAWLLPTGI